MKTALVFGRASGVWDEVAQAEALVKSYDYVIAVGSAGIDYNRPIDCWVTFHGDLFEDWILRREHKGYPPARRYWSSTYRGQAVRRRLPSVSGPLISLVACEGGSSGLIAVMVALNDLKADRVALAGIPLDVERGQYDNPTPWREAIKHRKAWETSLPQLSGQVRSFSGWTMQLLGGQPPTTEWLTVE